MRGWVDGSPAISDTAVIRRSERFGLAAVPPRESCVDGRCQTNADEELFDLHVCELIEGLGGQGLDGLACVLSRTEAVLCFRSTMKVHLRHSSEVKAETRV
jgi:hypothetical protein